ncbi:MAG: hypothetical protein IPH64_13975 [Comamonadaceae bacterium]|nr:hypothetical protein [Comamonadaceae bacterium]
MVINGTVANSIRPLIGVDNSDPINLAIHAGSDRGSVPNICSGTQTANWPALLPFLHAASLAGTRRFGIASGDADFAPLSLQLRELGCEVTCFAKKSIAFEAMAFCRRGPAPGRNQPEQSSQVGASHALKSLQTKGPARLRPAPPRNAIARKILGAVGLWRPHTIKQLNQLGTPLRESGIKSGNAPLHQLFRKCPAFFTVLPLKGAPKQVRLERSL